MIEFTEKWPGIRVAKVSNESAVAEISLYGGHVLSWKPLDSKEVLYTSPKSLFELGKPIRGGIPVCFPWFGPHPSEATTPPHGFARTSQWHVSAVSEGKGLTCLTLELCSSSESRLKWDNDFCLKLQISVGSELGLSLSIQNTGNKAFRITSAFHTYFSVADSTRLEIRGLEGSNYLDRVGEKTQRTQEGVIVLTGETDRVYQNPGPCTILDLSSKRRVHIVKQNFPDTIVWNPWAERSKAVGDLGENAYLNFVCVESGSVLANHVELAPSGSHTQTMTLRLE